MAFNHFYRCDKLKPVELKLDEKKEDVDSEKTEEKINELEEEKKVDDDESTPKAQDDIII